MSIKNNIDELDYETRQKINTDLRLEVKGGKWMLPYHITDDDIYLPFAYAIQKIKLNRRSRSDFSIMNNKFMGTLRDEQLQVKKDALDLLTKTGSVLISLYTGGGKTFLSINLACNIKLKTLVIVNKLVLIKQWEESILKVCPDASIQKLTTKSKIEDADFYIINAINVCKLGFNTFKDIGLCIIDETHLIMAETLSKSLHYISPRYLIGLSATPYREDGLNALFDLFFGEHKINISLYREHIVYRINTGIHIEMELCESTGKVNWGAVLKAQSENEERNEMIVKIVQQFPDNMFLILSKRIEQCNSIYKKLLEIGESVDNFTGSKKDFDKDARILIATNSKAGTGFDHPKLNALILACDLDSYYIQALGRIFRLKDTIPIVFDLVDNNPILLKHYKNRSEVYRKAGGKIKSFSVDDL